MLNLVDSPSEGTDPSPALAAFAGHMRRAALLWIAYEDNYTEKGATFREIVGTVNFRFAAAILDELLEQGIDAETAQAMVNGRQPAVPSQRLAVVTS